MEFVSTVKNAVKDRCTVKAEKISTVLEMISAIEVEFRPSALAYALAAARYKSVFILPKINFMALNFLNIVEF